MIALMEAVVLCGVQGSGKTTLFRDRFLATHVRVSMDLLRTRAREAEKHQDQAVEIPGFPARETGDNRNARAGRQ